jgi:hypothetical protein
MHASPEISDDTANELPYHPPKPWLVTVSLLAAFVVFGVCLCVLIYRGFTSADPKSVIVVLGNEKWKGATVTVEGGDLKTPLVAFVQDYNKYQIPFFVGKGRFTVRVDRAGFTGVQDVELNTDNMLATWTLAPSGPTTQKSP